MADVEQGVYDGGDEMFRRQVVGRRFAAENVVTMYDLHATILHLLGLDHERLTFRFGGRDMSLTDVHGRVVKEILG